ncbi:Co2+/Mg2+ efflux protein ApaG [Roseateles toxinivorans]|uniref:ApaG protein n=1 Tax=Roseateles toxinivorans TaxID=270368 RepID=A0A4V3CSW5_9BURK|nr:Co2+/Mg2+ efflux protein ApaG [Roseateles toxinivorans]TDP62447.1 ApaG protein [Roseateles toxinivorans]
MANPQFTCTVTVQPLPEQTDAGKGLHAFAYTINIKNSGDITAQLIARRWTITDARGHVDEVRGLAVVGHQPVLQPGQEFEYTSWAQLRTPQGTMQGSFLCVTELGEVFDTPVHEFLLADTSVLH